MESRSIGEPGRTKQLTADGITVSQSEYHVRGRRKPRFRSMPIQHQLSATPLGFLALSLVKPKVGQVVILHHVLLCFQPLFARALGLGFAARGNKI